MANVWFYELDPDSWRGIRCEFAELLCATDPAFWKAREGAAFATLMRLEHVKSVPPIPCPKKDRRGWIVVLPLGGQRALFQPPRIRASHQARSSADLILAIPSRVPAEAVTDPPPTPTQELDRVREARVADDAGTRGAVTELSESDATSGQSSAEITRGRGPVRDMVFVSHANPEDNEFTRWLVLQLANEGYPVWCDLTKLLGGEAFWEDIQEAIKLHTSRFLFVLSRCSNSKKGTLDELECANAIAKRLKGSVRDFIIPLKIDDLPHGDIYITIQRLNAVCFQDSWAKGLTQLLSKLGEDGVPKNPNFNADAVCSWWRSQVEYSAEQGLIARPEEHLSNWFSIRGWREKLHRHVVSRHGIGKIDFDTSTLPYPGVKDTELSFLSFADPADFSGALLPDLYIAQTEEIGLDSILDRTAPKGYSGHLSQLLRVAWERMMVARGLPGHPLSNRTKSFYFPKDKIKEDRLYFDGVHGKKTYRDVVGYSTRNGRKRYWHYAVSARPECEPDLHFVIKGHVLFSNDGLTIWKSKDKLAKARRSQCKKWWNDEWRDRMLAVMAHLADGSGVIPIPVASDLRLVVDKWPAGFESPVSYLDPKEQVKEELDDYSFEDDDTVEEIEGSADPEGES